MPVRQGSDKPLWMRMSWLGVNLLLRSKSVLSFLFLLLKCIHFFRSLQKLRKALPSTPVKRAAVLSAYTDPKRIPSSPAVQKFHVDSSYNTTDSALWVHKMLPYTICSF